MMSELWGGMRIPIMLLSGEVNSGKTLAGLLIDPNCRRPTAEVKPTTIWWDNEGSAETYSRALNFDWRDLRMAVGEGIHLRTMPTSPNDPQWRKILLTKADVNDSPSASLFRAWYLNLLSIEPGRYVVGGVDTFTPIQEGLIDWLRRHPEAFGRTTSQYDRAASIFMWPDLKNMLSYILATDCRMRFETFVLTVHLKNEWTGGRPTGQRIAEGLDVLDKLCTVHLRLDRSPKAKGKEAPRVPSAIVIKERLVRFGVSAADDKPILPPRLPQASADAIREYIARPADFAALKVDERMPDESLTEDQKLAVQSQIASDNRAAAEMKLSQIELMRLAAQGQAQQVQQAQQSQRVVDVATVVGISMATASQIAELERRLMNAFDSPEAGRDWFLKGSQGLKPPQLTESAMADCLIALTKLEAEKSQQRAAEKLAASGTKDTTDGAIAGPAGGTIVVDMSGTDGMATQEQRDRIRSLSQALGLGDEHHLAWLRERGVASYRSITEKVADERIAELHAMFPMDSIPF